jgi:hypothetical protein
MENLGDEDLFGWKKIYVRSHVNHDRSLELLRKEPRRWRNAAVDPAVTQDLSPEVTKTIKLDTLMRARPESFLAARLYVETNYEKDGHKWRCIVLTQPLQP